MDKARHQSTGKLGFTPSAATSPLHVLGQVWGCQFAHLQSSLVPSPELDTLEQFALSQPISSTVGAELELQRPSGFFLPLQNCLTSPEPAPQGFQQKA